MTTRRITTEPEVENDIRGRARGRLGSNESTFHDLHCGGEADHTRDLGHLLLESGNDRVQAIEYCRAIARMTKTQIEVKPGSAHRVLDANCWCYMSPTCPSRFGFRDTQRGKNTDYNTDLHCHSPFCQSEFCIDSNTIFASITRS